MQVTLKDVHQDYKIKLPDDVKVRQPAIQLYDDRGNPTPFKPDTSDPDYKLGGIKGSGSDVKKNHWAGFVLAKNSDNELVARKPDALLR